jgi:signal peptidase I
MAESVKKSSGKRSRMVSEAKSILLMLVLLTVARTSLANHYTVPTGSMENTLMPGDHVVVDMSAYGLRVPFTGITVMERGKPERGDIAVFKSPVDGSRLIKRVAAVGGDHVSLVAGHLTINGVAMATAPAIERFGNHRADLNLDRGGGPNVFDATIPQGQVLVMGDHRGDSFDGRYFGLMPASSLYARAVAVYWRSGEGLVWKRL